ncbi:hypothetical protein ACFLU6_01930 [Acidobacteriota bacterium]
MIDWLEDHSMFINLFTVLGVALLLFGLIRTANSFIRLVGRIARRVQTRRLRHQIGTGKRTDWPDGVPMSQTGAVPRQVKRFILFFVVSLISLPFLFVGSTLGRYVPIKAATEVLTVNVTPSGPGGMSINLAESGAGFEKVLYVKGNHWFMEADFIFFPDWARWVGLRNGIKVTKVVTLKKKQDLLNSKVWIMTELAPRDYLFFLLNKIGPDLKVVRTFTHKTTLQSSNKAIYKGVAGKIGLQLLPPSALKNMQGSKALQTLDH